MGDSKEVEMAKKADDLVRRITELEDKLVREAGRRPVVSPVPERPTDEEVQEHNVTHTPPKPWCPYCVKGTGSPDANATRSWPAGQQSSDW